MGFDLNLNTEQSQILDAAQQMLARHYPLSRMHSPEDLQAIAEFGTFTLALPEEKGGAGLSVVEESLLYRAFGRMLIGPSVLAQTLAERMGHKGDVAAAIPRARDFLFSGQGDHAVIFAPDTITLGRIDLQFPATGLGHSLPLTQGAVSPAQGDPALRPLADLLIGSALCGMAETARDMTITYAQTRSQFGRVIGSFQAIKHHLADMHIAAESLSSQCDMAAIALRDGAEDAHFQIAALRRLAPRYALQNARMCIQIHGGIGFTDEANPHLVLKSAHLWGQLFGQDSFAAQTAPMTPTRERITP